MSNWRATWVAAVVVAVTKTALAEPDGLESPMPEPLATEVTAPAPREPSPPSTTRMRTGYVAVGAAMLLGQYAMSVAIAGANANSSSATRDWTTNALYVPVVGPFVSMGAALGSGMDRGCTMSCGILPTGAFLLAVDGAVQATGLALFVFGLVSRVPVAPVPVVGKGFSGALISARF